jgi:hypothetical protein
MSLVFAGGSMALCISLLVLLAKEDSGETETSPEAEAGSAHRYVVLPGVVGIAVGAISYVIHGRVGGI